jgi:iron complex outermembrane receptor protein
MRNNKNLTTNTTNKRNISYRLAPFVWFVLFVVILATNIYAQEVEEEIIVLPEAEITEERERANVVTQEEMEKEGSTDLWEALRNVPGLIRSGGGGTDNESSFRVRGFDSSRFPVFVDGVPMSSPYWGNADYARILTGGIESVEVQKGFATMLLGANTMGGALLLHTAKPKNKLELSYKNSTEADGAFGYAGTLNVLSAGTKQDYFYGKAILQVRDIDHWTLSKDFVPFDRNPQREGERLYSDSNDINVTLLTGWTPNENAALNVSYTFLDADKGKSPPEVKGQIYRTDNWLLWRRSVLKLDGAYNWEKLNLDALFYFDKYDTTLEQTNGITTLTAHNDDYSLGARAGGAYSLNTWNILQSAINFKQESHDSEAIKIKENVWSFGAEYALGGADTPNTYLSHFTVRAGLGFDILQPYQFWSANNLSETTTRYMYSWQAGLFYTVTDNHEVRFTHAKKNHIPTMGQRYEEIELNAIPNPNLKNETAYHYELGYNGRIGYKINDTFNTSITIDAAVYYADLFDMIAEADVETATGGRTKVRMNIDKVAYYGFELGLAIYVCKYFSTGGTLSMNRYEIKESAGVFKVEGNFPRTTANYYMEISPLVHFNPLPLQTLLIIPVLEYEGPRYGHFQILNVGAPLERFALFNLRISSELSKNITLAFALENIFDTNYYLDSAYLPMRGRSFNITFTAKW